MAAPTTGKQMSAPLARARKLGNKLRRFAPLQYLTIRPEQEIDLGERIALPAGYSPTNPGMTTLRNQLLLSVRGINYRLENDTSLKMILAEGQAPHSVNRFLIIDRNDDSFRVLPGLEADFDDVEDIRLFSSDGKTMALGNAPSSQGGRLALFTLADGLDGVKGRQELRSPFELSVEKNWCPFYHKGELHFVYSIDPLIIFKFNGEKLSFVTAPVEAPPDFFLLSGSTPGLRVRGGYVFIAHRRSVRLPSLDRIYLHHVLFLDEGLSQVKVGPGFALGHSEIQFVAGMAFSGRTLFISYGRADRMARLARFDIEQIPSPVQIIPFDEMRR